MSKMFLLALALLITSPVVIFAQSDENVIKRRPDTPVKLEVQEIRQTATKIRSQVAANHATRLERRFNFYATRFEGIIARIKLRLQTLSTAGKDVSSLEVKLNTAISVLTQAKTKGAQAISAFQAIDPDRFSEQRSQALSARDLAKEARELFLETHQLLKEIILALKEIKL